MDKFKVNILPELTDKPFDNIVNEASSVVQIGNTTSSPLNIEVVHTGNTTSSLGVIYNNSTRTLYNLNRQEQDNIIKMNVNNKEVNYGISAAQFARNNISLLEDKIINASINGKLIIQNASYSTIKNLYDYVDNKNEYNLVLPLLKSLVDYKKRLHG